jgi:TPR repeat protein
MEVGAPPQNRPRTAGSKGSQGERYAGRAGPTDDFGRPLPPGAEGYGRPSVDSQRRPEDYGRTSADSQRRPVEDYGRTSANSQRQPVEDYGRPSVDSQRSRNYPPQGPSPPQQPQSFPDRRPVAGPTPPQGYDQRPAPGPAPQAYPDRRGPAPYGAPRNDYAEPRYDDRGYNGPVSPLREDFAPPARSMTMPTEQGPPPRLPKPIMNGPAPDERPYNGPIGRGMPPRPSTATGVRPPPQRNYPPEQYPADPYANQPAHQPNESISDFYDSYYEPPPTNGGPHKRSQSTGSEMPNFDLLQNGPKGGVEDVPPVNGFQGVKPMKSQPDFRRAQPQAAVFEMAGETPAIPSQYQQGYADQYAPQNGYNGQQPGYGYNEPQNGPPQNAYQAPPQQNGFQPPPRSTSAAPRPGLPSGPKSGLPNGPSPQNGGFPGPNGPPPQNAASSAHPAPVRAGLIPNSVANQANNKPPPVRNYNGSSPGVSSNPSNSQSSTPAPPAPPPVTEAEINQLKNQTKNNPNDYSSQLLLARKLVEASEVLVPKIPDQRARNKARERYVMDAHKMLKKLVAVQNTEAMFYLADCYGRGALGLETDNKEAFSLYQSAAKAGHAAAAYRTAVCCELGNEEGGGTRKDPMKAIQWYKRAATLGDTPAMYKMGMIQLKGLLGQPKNPREAVGWLKRAAERADIENPHALHELGLLYEQPQGPDGSILRDETYSLQLFQQAADLGYKFSQFRLGCAYEYGLFNLPISPRESIMWYSRAAVQEEHQSELALSGWYLTGSEGVLQQSDTEAYLWARKAAMAGLAKAEYAMGYFTEVGIGIPANLEDAKRWYWRAAGTFFLSLSLLSPLFLSLSWGQAPKPPASLRSIPPPPFFFGEQS